MFKPFDFQDNLLTPWTSWMENASKSMGGMMSSFTPPGKDSANWMNSWYEWWQQGLASISKDAGPFSPGDGMAVFGKVMEAMKIYQGVADVWMSTMAPLSKMKPGAVLSAEDIKDMQAQWQEKYNEMMITLWGPHMSKEAKEMMTAFSDATTTASEKVWGYLAPVLKNLEQVPEILQRMLKGDHGAAADFVGLFQKNYEETIADVFRAPSLGYAKEFVERFNKVVDSYIAFSGSMSQFQAVFYNTGISASQKIFEALAQLQGQPLTPETIREFYRIWWTINEDTYHGLFITEEFVGIMKEVLRRGLLFRQQAEKLMGDVYSAMNLPTRNDMDEIYKSIYELRKEVRGQARTIKKLEAQLSTGK